MTDPREKIRDHLCVMENKLEAGATTILTVVLFFASYEFERLAETYSDVFVAAPLRAPNSMRLPPSCEESVNPSHAVRNIRRRSAHRQ